ncbi:MAG: YcxB family protein [Breznakibacter sp.]
MYEITEELIIVTGESFNSQMTWEKTYKVLELKEWFLFYQNKLVANVVPKEFIGNQTHELREIIKRQNIKCKLRSN